MMVDADLERLRARCGERWSGHRRRRLRRPALVRAAAASRPRGVGRLRPGRPPEPGVRQRDTATAVHGRSARPHRRGVESRGARRDASDGVVHLAAVASGSEARAGSRRGLGGERRRNRAAGRCSRRARGARTGVRPAGAGRLHRRGLRRRRRAAPRSRRTRCCRQSPYAASKAGAEVAALEAWRRTGLRVVIARPFPHTGPGQASRFVVPALRRSGSAPRRPPAQPWCAPAISSRCATCSMCGTSSRRTSRCWTQGAAGRGLQRRPRAGVTAQRPVHRLAELVGVKVRAGTRSLAMRPADIPYLVGDASKIRAATGWAPRFRWSRHCRNCSMPKRTDLSSILLIGSGPIVIGQGAEFDYSGTQAVQGAQGGGLPGHPGELESGDDHDRSRSWPTGPTSSRSRPSGWRRSSSASGPTRCCPPWAARPRSTWRWRSHSDGVLEKYGVELIGANERAIRSGGGPRGVRPGDGAHRARHAAGPHRARVVEEALEAVEDTGYPAILRPSFTLGGTGGGIAYNRDEFETLVRRGLELSPVGSVLVERSIIGWKEFELEVMRDGADNVVIVCSIENLDPMGVHTGDSITVAPAMTLTDREYQVDARRGDPHHPRDRRRGRRLQHPVRGEPGHRRAAGHRDEPARLALLGARLQGHRLPDRAHRHQAGGGLPAGRAAQRHHQDHAGVVRAGARLRRGQDSPLRVREIPGGRPDADHPDEVGRRGRWRSAARSRRRSRRASAGWRRIAPGWVVGATPGRRPARRTTSRDASLAALRTPDAGADLPDQARAAAGISGRGHRRAHRDRSLVPRAARELLEAEREWRCAGPGSWRTGASPRQPRTSSGDEAARLHRPAARRCCAA